MARTANRGTMSASSPTSYNVMRWRLGKYIRLSKEDLLRGRDESNSVVNQRRLLEQYHQAHLDEFYEGAEADVYVDDGKTGTDTNREDFQRLLADCRRGLIDRVLVKSISRFARNTKECLETIRELKSLGVGVYFEKENIDTATMSGEMMTALFASFAQAESESISGNMRWSYQKRMQAGTYIPANLPYGYLSLIHI